MSIRIGEGEGEAAMRGKLWGTRVFRIGNLFP